MPAISRYDGSDTRSVHSTAKRIGLTLVKVRIDFRVSVVESEVLAFFTNKLRSQNAHFELGAHAIRYIPIPWLAGIAARQLGEIRSIAVSNMA
jgi:hypothetical protein